MILFVIIFCTERETGAKVLKTSSLTLEKVISIHKFSAIYKWLKKVIGLLISLIQIALLTN